jgi:hypothetical protein
MAIKTMNSTCGAQEYNAGLEARGRMLELVPPGRVVFLRPLKREGARATWDAVWIRAEELIREVSWPPAVEAPPCSRQLPCIHDYVDFLLERMHGHSHLSAALLGLF